MDEPRHPDAVAPDRTRQVDSGGLRLHVSEWGDASATPVVMCHGMFDHGRGFDLIAPRLAERYWVNAIDARGHGESEWADSYVWPLDVLDVINVLREIDRPAHLVGHSKGGGQATDAATLAADRVLGLINIDGFGPPDEMSFSRPGGPDDGDLTTAERCERYLDRRRTAARRKSWRHYASLEELVARRKQQNPRLEEPWLSYFVYHAARETERGWVWKSDPHIAGGGFGPFRPEWIAPSWQNLQCTMLAITGSEPDTWGPLPESVLGPRLDYVPRLERATIEGTGHFVHMEQPRETADVVRDFLDSA
jgi:pimeloyl-ACP methyl ester carboxylesterase